MTTLFFSEEVQYLFPEIYLVIVVLFFLMFGVFYTPKGLDQKSPYIINCFLKISLLVLLILFILLVLQLGNFSNFLLFSRIVINDYTIVMKLVLVLFFISFIFMSLSYFRGDTIKTYEIVLLFLLSLLGMFVMLNSYDFTIMYLSLELQTICFYILAAYKTQSNSSTEAGIKYFVLGSFSSGLLLFGISLIYGFTGTTNFQDLSYLLVGLSNLDIGALILGILFILVGLLFKLGAAPFHVWLPDVYEGSPTVVTAFFASIAKIPAMILFITVIYFVFYSFVGYWHVVVLVCAIISMFIGGLGALYQNKIKRLVAYSSISHMGFLLLGISSGTLQGLQATSVYLFIYLLLTINFFSIIFGVRKYVSVFKIKTLDDFRLLFKSNPIIAIILSLNLFSYAGIPPLAGFFGKFYVLSVSTNVGMYFVVFFAIVFSIISSVYYIRLVKLMFFEKSERWSLYRTFSYGAALVLGYTTVFNIFFFFYASPLVLIMQNSVFSMFS